MSEQPSTSRIVTHRAIRPADGKVIQAATMLSTAFWAPYIEDPPLGGGLRDWWDDVMFQTSDGGDDWQPAIIVIRMRQVTVTTLDAFKSGEQVP